MVKRSGQEITVTSRDFDGSLRRTWKADLISSDHSMIELVGAFEREVEHADLGNIDRGTLSYEYYWLDQWYNVFRFHRPSGEFRNYYCNINMPPSFENTTLDYVDLDIDLLIEGDRQIKILDMEEFQENIRRFAIPESVVTSAHRAVDHLITLIEKRTFPFDRY